MVLLMTMLTSSHGSRPARPGRLMVPSSLRMSSRRWTGRRVRCSALNVIVVDLGRADSLSSGSSAPGVVVLASRTIWRAGAGLAGARNVGDRGSMPESKSHVRTRSTSVSWVGVNAGGGGCTAQRGPRAGDWVAFDTRAVPAVTLAGPRPWPYGSPGPGVLGAGSSTCAVVPSTPPAPGDLDEGLPGIVPLTVASRWTAFASD